MCNLYRPSPRDSEGFNVPTEVYPGYPGIVEVGGERQKMVWGFPLKQTSQKTGKPLKPKPVNNARSDKLDSFMWRFAFQERRCLIWLSAWCEAEGQRGAKTRTWLSLPGVDAFAVAGIWTESDEWGRCFSMVMTDSAGPAAGVHSRMPVLLIGEDQQSWVSGSKGDAAELCRPFTDDLTIDRTDQPWHAR